MAHFNIKLKKHGARADVSFYFSNDIKHSAVDYLKQMFEIEMMGADVTTNKKSTRIKFQTNKLDIVEAMRQGALRAWMEYKGTKPSEN